MIRASTTFSLQDALALTARGLPSVLRQCHDAAAAGPDASCNGCASAEPATVQLKAIDAGAGRRKLQEAGCACGPMAGSRAGVRFLFPSPQLLQHGVTATRLFRDMDFPVGVTYRADVDSCGS